MSDNTFPFVASVGSTQNTIPAGVPDLGYHLQYILDGCAAIVTVKVVETVGDGCSEVAVTVTTSPTVGVPTCETTPALSIVIILSLSKLYVYLCSLDSQGYMLPQHSLSW